MTSQTIKTVGEVALNALDAISEFEQKCVIILWHAEHLYDIKDLFWSTRQGLFYNRSSRCHIVDLINIFSVYYLRSIVRQQPNCACVGVDEKGFTNILDSLSRI